MTPHLYVESMPQLPSDEELDQLVEYVGGLMTDEQVEAYEDRLADDADFFARIHPMLEAWSKPALVPAEVAMRDRLEHERVRRAVMKRRLRSAGIALGVAIAAGIGFAIIPTGHRKPVEPDRPIASVLPPVHDSTPVKVPEVVVAAVTPRRPVKRQPAPEILDFGESEADRLLAQSAVKAMPGLDFVPTTVDSATIEIKGTEIAAAEMPKDTAATNAYKRYIGLTTTGKNLGDGGNWLRKHLPGFLFPLGGSAKPTPVGKPPMRWMR